MFFLEFWEGFVTDHVSQSAEEQESMKSQLQYAD